MQPRKRSPSLGILQKGGLSLQIGESESLGRSCYSWAMPLVLPPSPSPSSPVALRMEHIALLQAELELAQNGPMALASRVREAWTPFRQSVASEYQALLESLGELYHSSHTPRSLQRQIQALALFLVERAASHGEVSLQGVLEAQGLAPAPEEPPAHTPEQEAAWDSFEWEDPEVWAQRSKKKRKQAPKKDAADEAQQLAKRLYHGLARELHPDKAAEEERVKRTELMQRLNAAYKASDLHALLSLLGEHGASGSLGSLDSAALEAVLKALDRQQRELKQAVRKAWAALPDWGTDWKALLRSTDQQERLLRGQKRLALERAAHLRELREHLQQPKELARFLNAYGDEAWEAIF